MSKFAVTIAGQRFEVELPAALPANQEAAVTVNGRPTTVFFPEATFPAGAASWMVVKGRPYELIVDPHLHWLRAYGGLHPIEVQDLEAAAYQPRSGDGRVKAPIPGLITHVLVAPGQEVTIGQTLLILEAMKMENEIRSPCAGRVSEVMVTSGQGVARNDVLVEVVT